MSVTGVTLLDLSFLLHQVLVSKNNPPQKPGCPPSLHTCNIILRFQKFSQNHSGENQRCCCQMAPSMTGKIVPQRGSGDTGPRCISQAMCGAKDSAGLWLGIWGKRSCLERDGDLRIMARYYAKTCTAWCSSCQPQVAIEHLKYGCCDWRMESSSLKTDTLFGY